MKNSNFQQMGTMKLYDNFYLFCDRSHKDLWSGGGFFPGSRACKIWDYAYDNCSQGLGRLEWLDFPHMVVMPSYYTTVFRSEEVICFVYSGDGNADLENFLDKCRPSHFTEFPVPSGKAIMFEGWMSGVLLDQSEEGFYKYTDRQEFPDICVLDLPIGTHRVHKYVDEGGLSMGFVIHCKNK